jgi:type 1 glutamine amidotransferase
MLRRAMAAFPYRTALALATLVALPALAHAADAPVAKSSPKLKALLIAGGCCHDYPTQNKIIAQGISQRASVAWDVAFEPGGAREAKLAVYGRPDWIMGYDIVVHNECYGSVADVEYVEGIARAHGESGIPAIVIHCSMHSYRAAKTDEWRKLVGVSSFRHEKGNRRLDVVKVDKSHPIMQGFPDKWLTPNGELYIIEKAWPDLHPLATTPSIETKTDQPCMWTNQYLRARVFGTTIGHHNETMRSSEWLDVVSRGLLWACGKLNDDGTPAAGFAGTGIGPLDLAAAPQAEPAGPRPTPADWSASVKFPASEKPARLFNGKDLDGWEGHKEKYFNVRDGILVAKNGGDDAPKASTYLLTEKKYRDFRLVFESKLVESKMHSGIALWGEKAPEKGDPFTYRGHLVMFPEGWGYYDLYRRNSIYKDDGRAKKADRVGDWNRMEILAIGSRIRHAANGQLVADWTDPMPELCRPGQIGLQLHSNSVPQEVHFRGLILAENPEDRMITVE